MNEVDADLRDFAEDSIVAFVPGPGEERVDDPRFVLAISPGEHFWCASVGRVRLPDAEVEIAVADTRLHFASRDHSSSVWTIGDSATPEDLVDRLLALGMEREGISDVLVMTAPPLRDRSSELEVREVGTLRDHLAVMEVTIAGFDFPEADAIDERSRARDSFVAERLDPASLRLLALDGGRPIAGLRMWFSPRGLYLGSVTTLPDNRGRGAMTSLIAQTWEIAVERGTPALTCYAGDMSSPPLRRLGFRRTGGVIHLIDRW